jgi:hypothetical protein
MSIPRKCKTAVVIFIATVMRKPAAWMRQLDGRILEHLQESGESNPMLMAEGSLFGEMEVSSGQIRDRCAKLAEAPAFSDT